MGNDSLRSKDLGACGHMRLKVELAFKPPHGPAVASSKRVCTSTGTKTPDLAVGARVPNDDKAPGSHKACASNAVDKGCGCHLMGAQMWAFVRDGDC